MQNFSLLRYALKVFRAFCKCIEIYVLKRPSQIAISPVPEKYFSLFLYVWCNCVIDRKLLMPVNAFSSFNCVLDSLLVTCLMNDHYVLKLQNCSRLVSIYCMCVWILFPTGHLICSFLSSQIQWLYNYWFFLFFLGKIHVANVCVCVLYYFLHVCI